ncbi:MAG: MarR family transcriptional regulator [Proteobacteria bacterium]|nr:MarR family transcriptional regulator [Pseudomonadota bacterium]
MSANTPPAKSKAAKADAKAGSSKRGGAVSLGSLRNFIGFQLRRAQDVSFEAFARRVGSADFGPGHFAALSVIHANPDINQVRLSRATGRDKSTLTPVIKNLLKRGFVQRHRSKTDSRAYCLNLTPKGEHHLQKLAMHAEAHDRRLDQIVGDIHKGLLIHLLERIVTELEHDLHRT